MELGDLRKPVVTLISRLFPGPIGPALPMRRAGGGIPTPVSIPGSGTAGRVRSSAVGVCRRGDEAFRAARFGSSCSVERCGPQVVLGPVGAPVTMSMRSGSRSRNSSATVPRLSEKKSIRSSSPTRRRSTDADRKVLDQICFAGLCLDRGAHGPCIERIGHGAVVGPPLKPAGPRKARSGAVPENDAATENGFHKSQGSDKELSVHLATAYLNPSPQVTPLLDGLNRLTGLGW
jgi:hypothetical protein